jgi:predicted NodU family carbamoyl transferase
MIRSPRDAQEAFCGCDFNSLIMQDILVEKEAG